MKVLILILLSIKSLSACCSCCASGSDEDVVVQGGPPPIISQVAYVQPTAPTLVGAGQTSSMHAPNPFILDATDDDSRPRESSCATGLPGVDTDLAQPAGDDAERSPQPKPLQIDPAMDFFSYERQIIEAALKGEAFVLTVLQKTNPQHYGKPIDTEGNTIFHHICYLGFADAARMIARQTSYSLGILSQPNLHGVVPIQIANGFALGTPQRQIFVFLKRHEVPLPGDPLEGFVAFPKTPLMRLGSFGRALREGGAGS